eukprot:COSAG02_NODE_18914_length_910_cov_3.479655_1_plen_45_part_10
MRTGINSDFYMDTERIYEQQETLLRKLRLLLRTHLPATTYFSPGQ